MRKNDICELEITGMTDDGSGVGRADGLAVFVPYTIVGEVVLSRIIKLNKNYAVGRLEEIIKPSENRIKSDCEYFRKCGGCALWHMDYKTELEYKRRKTEDCLRRIGGFDITVPPVLPAQSICRYRNKAMLPVTGDGIGFYRRNSHSVIDMEDCLLQDENVGRIAARLRELMAELGLSPYDEKTGRGLIRHLCTRTGSGEILVIIVAASTDIPRKDELVSGILSLKLPICGIVLNVNKKAGNTVLGGESVTLWGRGSVTVRIGELSFEVSPNSFCQVNTEQTAVLYGAAKRMAALTDGETVWDLYCGTGTIGQFMADNAEKIIGVELIPQAIENARKNAERNGISNTEYYCGAAEKLAPELVKKGLKPDIVILDPPRKGCDAALLDTVCSVNPKKIVYISCKPSTLARDLKYLAKRGYSPTEVAPVDMFPRTPHVETVVLLTK